MKRILLLCLAIFTAVSAVAQEKLKAADIVSRSLEAVGAPEARAKLQYFEWGGNANVQTTFRSISATGTAVLVSENRQLKFATKLDSKSYSGDQFVYNGSKIMVSQDNRGQRSPLGEFLYSVNPVLGDGLLGGVLSTAWPLYEDKLHGAKLDYDGLKNVNGTKLHQVTYSPKKADDRLIVHMYFDDQFRHVRTTYEYTFATGMGPKGSRSPGTDSAETIYLLEETFGGFLKIAGLTLPTKHKLVYQSSNAQVGVWNYEMRYNNLNGTKLPEAE